MGLDNDDHQPVDAHEDEKENGEEDQTHQVKLGQVLKKNSKSIENCIQ